LGGVLQPAGEIYLEMGPALARIVWQQLDKGAGARMPDVPYKCNV